MTHPAPRAGLWRRLAALLYDRVLIASLLMVTSVITTALNRGQAITADHPLFHYYQLILVAVVVVFYGQFWMRGGQTLGMKAWRIQLRTQNGEPIGWLRVLRRCSAGLLSWLPLGLGYLWLLIDRDRLTWHDRLSGTEVVVLLPHPPKQD